MKALFFLVLLLLIQVLIFFPPKFTSSNQSTSTGPAAAQAFIRARGVIANFTFVSGALNLTGIVDVRQGLMNPDFAYTWHIDQDPVGRAGDCSLLRHRWDPFNRRSNGSDYHCTMWNDCALGDLSGKFGRLKPAPSSNGRVPPFQFQDPTLSLVRANNIIGRSIVIQNEDGINWVCANITATSD